jgi:hypothetical protein
MLCRICEGKCEKDDIQYAGLCRTCGQKRETYAAAAEGAALTFLLNTKNEQSAEDRRNKMIESVFTFAEAMVRRDRKNS